MGWFSRWVGRVAARALESDMLGGYDFQEYADASGGVQSVAASRRREVYYSNAFRACLLAKARPLSSLPVHVYERVDGVRREAPDAFSQRLGALLRTRWNPFVTASEGVRWAMMTKDTLGEAFVRVEYDGAGLPVALWPMSGAPMVGAHGSMPTFSYGGDKFTPAGTYLAHEVVWVKSPVLDSDCIHGVSLAELAARELDLSIDLEEFYGNVVRGDSTFAGWLETDQKLQKQDVDNIREQLSDGGGIVNAGRVRIFDKGLSYRSNGQSMVDLSLVEQERWILQQTCRTLSVPPQEVFDLSNATYSNIEQGALNFANKTLVPECHALEEALSSVLWAAGRSDCYVQMDMNGLLRGSYRERMDGYRIAVYGGWLTRADVRSKEDMAPIEGLDRPLVSAAYNLVDPATGEVVPMPGSSGAAMPGGSGESERDSGGDPHARGTALAVVHDDMARRVRERYEERGDGERFRDFARRVLTPLADAYEVDGIEYDMESDIEEIING